MKCPECGAENNPNAKHCNQCGAALPHQDAEVAANADTSTNTEAPKPIEEPTTAATPAKESGGKPRNTPVVIVDIAAAAVVAMVVVVFAMSNGASSS